MFGRSAWHGHTQFAMNKKHQPTPAQEELLIKDLGTTKILNFLCLNYTNIPPDPKFLIGYLIGTHENWILRDLIEELKNQSGIQLMAESQKYEKRYY